MELGFLFFNLGFLIDIICSGQIVYFLYYGEGYKVEVLNEFVVKEKVVFYYLNIMFLQLMYDVIDGEQVFRFVYELILLGYSYFVDVDEIVFDQYIVDERIENGVFLLLFQNMEEINIYVMLGFIFDMQKVSEKDFGEEIGSMW